MFVDDNEGIRDYLVSLADIFNLNSLAFSSGVEALKYLEDNSTNLPRAYVVDMRIPGSADELVSSERIYEFLKARNAHDLFTYFTGCLSDHDVEVQRRTGASILIKSQQLNELKEFFKRVCDNQ